MLIKY